MKPGDKITISAPGRGICSGEVDAIIDPAQLPEIEGAPEVERVKAILEEGAVDTLMLLTYYEASGNARGMFALHTHSGEWWDMRGQRLTIVPVEQRAAT